MVGAGSTTRGNSRTEGFTGGRRRRLEGTARRRINSSNSHRTVGKGGGTGANRRTRGRPLGTARRQGTGLPAMAAPRRRVVVTAVTRLLLPAGTARLLRGTVLPGLLRRTQRSRLLGTAHRGLCSSSRTHSTSRHTSRPAATAVGTARRRRGMAPPDPRVRQREARTSSIPCGRPPWGVPRGTARRRGVAGRPPGARRRGSARRTTVTTRMRRCSGLGIRGAVAIECVNGGAERFMLLAGVGRPGQLPGSRVVYMMAIGL